MRITVIVLSVLGGIVFFLLSISKLSSSEMETEDYNNSILGFLFMFLGILSALIAIIAIIE